jgi:hypothetical protein
MKTLHMSAAFLRVFQKAQHETIHYNDQGFHLGPAPQHDHILGTMDEAAQFSK